MLLEEVAGSVRHGSTNRAWSAPTSNAPATRWESESRKLQEEWRRQQEWIAELQEAKEWHERRSRHWESESQRTGQAILDYYWESASWKALGPIRRILGFPPGLPPKANSAADAWQAASKLQESWSWNVTAPFRLVGTIFRYLRRLIG
jgi:hypothetical protein